MRHTTDARLIRHPDGRIEPASGLVRVDVVPPRIDKSLLGAILYGRSAERPNDHPLVLPANAKEAPTMHPPDGPLDRLHSSERNPLSMFCRKM